MRSPAIPASMIAASSSSIRSIIWRQGEDDLGCRLCRSRFRESGMMASAPAASPVPPQVLLAPHLRQLKLPTFLREYEKLAAEAAREGLGQCRRQAPAANPRAGIVSRAINAGVTRQSLRLLP